MKYFTVPIVVLLVCCVGIHAQEIQFNDMAGGKGTTKDGAPFSFHHYQSSDGIGVSVTRENRDTRSRAQRALKKRLKGAARIIERGEKVNEKDSSVGQRVVAEFALDGSDKTYVSIIWTYGGQLYFIESSSLQHALEFEKRFY